MMTKTEFAERLREYEKEYCLYYGLVYDSTHVEIEDIEAWLENSVEQEIERWSAG